ncbi:GUN4 domain-containing protein [Oculatella sp. FACHB-28]|uniref:GUN4 domain-containing protein n=1 Tax=Oculatella sp. FACHB-28 TaxID=2692845 RepID=UPI001683D7CA|nr:GUN4 domain-containing protein [Oculatella sp. FACHB-28]
MEQQKQSADTLTEDCTRREELLEAKKWKEADEQTKKLLLVNNQNNSLTAPEIRQLPLDFLDIIDQLWMKYSDGKFGLRVQRQLWQNILEPEKPALRYLLKR